MNQFSLFSMAGLVLGLLVLAGCSESPVGLEANDGAFALESTATTADMGGQEIMLEADLRSTSADPLADGTARWEQRDDGRLKFTTEVQDVSTDGTGRVIVFRPGTGLILDETITIVLGMGDLNLDTDNGQAVPQMEAGDRVVVVDPNGMRILRGRLQTATLS